MRNLSTTALLAAVLLAAGARAEDALDRTRKLVEAFKGARSADAKAFAALDAFFDFETFSSACLGPSAAKLTPAQAREFKERLTEIVRRRGYPSGGKFFREGALLEGKPAPRGPYTAVPLKATFAAQDVTMELEFVWSPAGKVVDLVLDGDALTRDYQNQVARILAKSGPEDLLRRLAEKQKALEQERL